MIGLGLSLSNSSFVGGFKGLLDEYSGAAAAYSLRRLSGSYTGPAIKVRNKSTQNLFDIGFDANGDLDMTALAAAANETGATKQLGVVTWYDQSGNGNDVTQGSGSSQPNIYLGSGPILENGLPAMDFGSSSELEKSSVSISSNAYSFFSVSNTTGTAQRNFFRQRELGSFGTVEGVAFLELTGSTQIQNTFIDDGVGNALIASSGAMTQGQHLVSTHYTLSTASMYVDGTQEGSSSVPSGSTPLNGPIDLPYLNVGGLRFSRPWANTVQEIVLFDAEQLTNRAEIETNINDYYSIY